MTRLWRRRGPCSAWATRRKWGGNWISSIPWGGWYWDALVLAEEIDGETYLTRIYYHDGYIRELFCAADAEMEPGDGEQIIETCDLKISPGPTGHEIIAEMTDGTGETTRLVLTLRCERGTPE